MSNSGQHSLNPSVFDDADVLKEKAALSAEYLFVRVKILASKLDK